MHRITEVEPTNRSTIRLRFDDGTVADMDFAGVVARGGVFTPLSDPAFFRQVTIGPDARSLEWPGDLEFCADALWQQAINIGESKTEIVEPALATS